MKTCRVKPSASECRMCAVTTEYFDQIPDCSKCGYRNARYELISIVSGIFNDYAFVQSMEKVIKVSLNRVYDIREE